jgi:chlorobactene glucosyltransferase
MGFVLESIYVVLVILCFAYFLVLLQYSRNGWQFIGLNENDLPSVSIIVPTLEEEVNIRKCLESLLDLQYSNKEIIVVDGGSKDKTVEIANKYPVKVIVDENLPTGWIGKSYGCHVGYMASKGEILLFTDADTTHKPEALKIAVSHLLGTESVLFSIFPYQKANKWHEFLPSFLYFLSFLAGGPRNEINNPYSKDAFLASGQYMMFTRKGYIKLGGHLAVSDSLVEDVALAKLCKEKELKLSFIDGVKIVETRMYPEGFSQFYRAFRRSIWGGLITLSPWRIMFVIFWLIYFLLAPYFLIQSFIFRPSWMWFDYTIGIFVNVGLYLAYALAVYLYWIKRGDTRWYYYLFFPITQIINFVVIGAAIINGLRGKKVDWRGRYYSTKDKEEKKIDEPLETLKSIPSSKRVKTEKILEYKT